MERKEDIILECFVVKGSTVDFLGMIYLEKGEELKALIRLRSLENRTFLKFLSGKNQKGLSERVLREADLLAEGNRLPSVHLTYPQGIRESLFIQSLRQAQAEWEARIKAAEN